MSYFFVTPGNRKPPRDEERDGSFEKNEFECLGPVKRGRVYQGSEEKRMFELNGQETYGLQRKKNL